MLVVRWLALHGVQFSAANARLGPCSANWRLRLSIKPGLNKLDLSASLCDSPRPGLPGGSVVLRDLGLHAEANRAKAGEATFANY